MENSIEIRGRDRTSRIIIGETACRLREFLPGKRVVAVTDSNVHRHYRELVESFDHIIIGMGETNKTLATLEKVYRELISLEADRDTFILGVGGGIVTDVAGFAASTYMRGLEFGFVATTLMAQVDAGIGGKNGVNVDSNKNMAGTVTQPSFVVCDPCFLETLPEREFRAGLAEVLKAGIIADPEIFPMLENREPEDIRDDRKLLTQLIYRAVSVKADIVNGDEMESGQRRLLNLGHTFAHAIEKCYGQYNHGEAVGIGLRISCGAAVKLGILPATDAARINHVLDRLALPRGEQIDPRRLLTEIRADKKRHGDSIRLVLPQGIGKTLIREIPLSEVEGLITVNLPKTT